MQILRWVDGLCRRGGRLADQVSVDGVAIQQCLYLSQPLRPITCADHTYMRIAHPAVPILVIKKGDAGDRKITLPLGEFLKGPAPMLRPERQVQFGNDLVRLAHCRQWPREEFAGRYGPSSRCTDEGDLGIAGHGNPGQFGGRVGMGKAAADGAAVADLIMRDVGHCLAQQRVRGGQPPIVLDVAPANPGAKPNAALADGNVAEPGNPAQINEQLGAASRKARTGIRLCPPAITVASGSDTSRSIASRSVAGA